MHLKPAHVVRHQPKPKPRLPIGDAVAAILAPAVAAVDAVAGTKLGECGGCKARQELLNRAGEAIAELVAGKDAQ